MWFQRFLISILLCLLAGSALALDRPFPPIVKRGKMTPGPYPAILIDGKNRQLSAGGRIWNQENLIEMPAAIVGADLVVNYTENDQGEIDRVWILTADEAARSIKQQQ